MNYSFEYIDIILLAMIAGFIFLRLRGILGKRTGFEGKAPAQFQEIIKNIKFLSKELKITIAGVKKILEYNIKKLDDLNRVDYRETYKLLLKHKIDKLFLKVKGLKKYGKKNSSKSSNGSRKQSWQ